MAFEHRRDSGQLTAQDSWKHPEEFGGKPGCSAEGRILQQTARVRLPLRPTVPTRCRAALGQATMRLGNPAIVEAGPGYYIL